MKARRYAYQIAAVPVRLDEDRRAEIGLVTSRGTGRWIIPKGWPMKGRRDDEAAAVEAEEEAGLVGSTLRATLGSYTYWRRTRIDFKLTRVDAFVLRVKRQKKSWKEQDQRSLIWLPLLEAADRVLEPELSTLLIGLPGNQEACDFLSRGKGLVF